MWKIRGPLVDTIDHPSHSRRQQPSTTLYFAGAPIPPSLRFTIAVLLRFVFSPWRSSFYEISFDFKPPEILDKQAENIAILLHRRRASSSESSSSSTHEFIAINTRRLKHFDLVNITHMT
ncbi:hypothetical protein Rs2_31733 [Raphanus sativus]|nr:hypothetical protein Rs2_31733 [Raphanus sativus]